MRVVIDTNVLVSAMLWGGKPRQLFHKGLTGEVILVISEVLLDELADVLSRSKFAAELLRVGTSVEEIVELVRRRAEVVLPAQIDPAIAADPDDDAVLACAIAGRADAIVSSDRHLLELAQYRAIPIVTASALLERLAE